MVVIKICFSKDERANQRERNSHYGRQVNLIVNQIFISVTISITTGRSVHSIFCSGSLGKESGQKSKHIYTRIE